MIAAAAATAPEAWFIRLLDTSWQAGLVVIVAWAICRLLPPLPAHVRAAMWWLVCVKFVVGLLWPQPIALRVLPVAAGTDAPANAVGAGRSHITVAIDTSSSAPVPSIVPSSATGVIPTSSRTLLPRMLLGFWSCGVLLQLASMWRAWRRMRALVERSTPVRVSMAALADDLSLRLGIRRASVRVSRSIDTPRVTGVLAPTILLPAAAEQLSTADLEMTLCHELLHIRRRDLLLGWLPSLAQTLFFFHPCAWIATREHALAREQACDAAVLRILDAAPDAYGDLLVRLGVARGHIAPIAVGASSSFRTLKRRLIMLQHVSNNTRSHAARSWMIAAVAAMAIVPLHLVAQTRLESLQSPADAQTLGERQSKIGEYQSQLGEQQSRIGAEMTALSDKLNELNARQLEVATKQIQQERIENVRAHIEREMHKISEQISQLEERQQALDQQQHALDVEQEQFHRQQDLLAIQQELASKRTEQQLREMIERAVAHGLAEGAIFIP